MKRFMLAAALTCAISATALAGNIPIGDAPAPAPPAPQSSSVVVTVVLTILSFVR